MKARAPGVCFEGVIFLKSGRFSRCFSFPGTGSGELLGMAPCCVQRHSAESSRKLARGDGAAEVSPVQLQECGAALPCS